MDHVGHGSPCFRAVFEPFRMNRGCFRRVSAFCPRQSWSISGLESLLTLPFTPFVKTLPT